jgi:hypothetical protein
VPILQTPDPDFEDLVKGSVTVPESWWDRLDVVAKRQKLGRSSAVIQLVRWSLDKGDVPPYPEGPNTKGPKATTSVHLSAGRWSQIDAEAETRGLSRNKVFQAHLLRALLVEESNPAPERKSRR